MANYPGARKRVTFTCTDLAGTATDPTALAIEYGPLGGTATTKSWPTDDAVVKDSAGVFHIDIDCPTAGTWAARAIATGALVAVTEIQWPVSRSAFTS